MKLNRRQWTHRLGAKILLTIQRYLLKKSPQDVERWGMRLGRLLHRISRKHRDRARSNLALAFPEMSEPDRNALAVRCFEHFGRETANFLVSARRDLAQLEATTESVNFEAVEKALAHKKGVLILTAHLGNWERSSRILSLKGYKLTAISRAADADAMNELLSELRQEAGTSIIPRGDAIRPILRCLRDNEMVAILPDQNSDEAFLPFFGKPAGTVLGPGVIHERTGSPILFGHCVWVAPGRYKMVSSEPMFFPPSGGQKGEATMRAYYAWLEDVVRQYPEQYLWFHDRWKNARRAGLL